MIRMEASQKTAKGVHINDLAEYIDRQAENAGNWQAESWNEPNGASLSLLF
jgi:hypothetical protein